jgi:hypothetical protein
MVLLHVGLFIYYLSLLSSPVEALWPVNGLAVTPQMGWDKYSPP